MTKRPETIQVPQYLYAILSYQASIQARQKHGIKHNEVVLFMFYATLDNLGYELTRRRVRTVFKSFGRIFINRYTPRLIEHGLIIEHTSQHKYTSIPYNFFTISDKGYEILSEIEEGFYTFYRNVVEKR